MKLVHGLTACELLDNGISKKASNEIDQEQLHHKFVSGLTACELPYLQLY